MNRLRVFAALPLALGIVLGLLAPAGHAADVKVGLIAPMSGPWARQGDLMLKGATLAVDRINAQGGVKALGGAKMRIVVFDAGDSVEKAKNAAQRMVAQEPDLVGAAGAWLSSFTLGVTEVTEASSTCSRPRPRAAPRPSRHCRRWSSSPKAPPAESRGPWPSSWTTPRRR
jgi:hypothetical protein